MKNSVKRSRTLRRQQARLKSTDPQALPRLEGNGRMTLSAQVLIVGASAISLLPLLLYWNHFDQLFFFHDDFLLLDELSRTTLLRWIFHPFENESIFPLFKATWFVAVEAFGGSYMALLALLWVTHTALCLVFGWLLIRLRLPPVAAGFAVLTFGLASSNLETLAWSIQWNSQLSLLFFLLAWHALVRILEGQAAIRWYVGYVVCTVASTLCSSRGVVCGLLLAVFTLLAGGRQRVKLCAASAIPTAILVLITWIWVPVTRPSHVGATAYGLNYLAINPLFQLAPRPLGLPHAPSPGTVWLLGAIKAGVIAWAFYKSSRRLHPFLLALVLFDVATAAALGYARAWTGLSTVVSSRYQYIPLLCFGPMLGILVAGWKKEITILAFIVSIWILSYRWESDLDRWAFQRGTHVRQLLATYPPNAPFDPSKITAQRGRQLIEQYRLH